MKRYARIALTITALILCIGCMTGCGKSDEEIKAEFSKIIANKATPETMAEAEEYTEKYAKKMSGIEGSIMVSQLEDYLIQYIYTDRDDVQVQSLAAYFDKETGVLEEEKIKDGVTKDYYDTLREVHIYPVYFEDKVQLRVNYTALNETFGKTIHPALNQLFGIKVLTTDEPATKNASLQIGYTELLERAMTVEDMIEEYPDNVLIMEEVQWLYSTYLDLIMMGTTNTPVFDYTTGEFREEARTAYEMFLKEQGDTTLAWVLNEYFAYLETIDYALNYKDSTQSKLFFDTCYGIRVAAEKRVFEQNELQ